MQDENMMRIDSGQKYKLDEKNGLSKNEENIFQEKQMKYDSFNSFY